MSYSHFLGVYLHAKPIKQTKEYQELSCPTKKCGNHKKQMSTPFCPVCGAATEKRTFKNTEETDISELLHDEETGDEVPFFLGLASFRGYIYSDKLTNHFDVVCDEDQNEKDAIFVDGQEQQLVFNAQEEINKFKELHAEQIAKFIELGFKPMLKFGPLSEWD